MGTKVEILINKNGVTSRRIMEAEIKGKEAYPNLVYYCKESPFEVLAKLFPKYHITEFKGLQSHIGSSLESMGLSIQEFNSKEGLIPTKSIKHYKPSVSKEIIRKCQSAEGFLERAIKDYLIEKQIIDRGSGIENVVTGQKFSKRYGKQKIIEYVKEREKKKDSKKEKYFQDILNFGKVVMKGKFDIKTIKKMSHKIAKEIPTQIEPVSYTGLGGVSMRGGFLGLGKRAR